MSFMLNPGLDPFEKEIPVSLQDKSAGTIKLVLQPIPVGKYRALCRDLDDKRTQLQKVGDLLDQPLNLDGVLEADEISKRVEERSKLNKLREKAEEALYISLMTFVGWGVIGYSDIYKADKITPYEATPFSVKWAGFDYKNLDPQSLHLFGKLGLLWHLCFVIMSAQNGQLPATVEDFFKQDPKEPVGA